MAYIGQAPINGFHAKQQLTGDGSTVTFTLDQTVATETGIIVSVGGVLQEPSTAYNLTVGGTKITFTEAPASTDRVYIHYLGKAIVQNIQDVNGAEFVLDANGNTSFTADTDDEIDIKVGGSDINTIKSTGFHNLDNIKFVAGTGDDLEMYHDGTNSLIANKTGALKIATETSGIAVTIGHTTSEVTIADNATVTGNLTVTGTLTQTGTQTFDGGIDVDNFNINGTTIALSSGDMTLDSAGDIILDADGGDVFFKDAGTTFGSATNTSGNLIIKSGTTTALTFAGANATLAGTLGVGAVTSTGIVTGTAFTAGSAVLAEAELELLDGLTAGTAIASKVVTTDANIDTTGQRNLTISGELDAATGDFSGDVDIDGTLEADAITVNGTALASVIAGTTVNLATLASTVTITDNESTDENNAIIFAAGGDVDGGSLGLESDGNLTYNPSSGTLNVPNISVTGTQTIVNSVTMNASNAVIFEGATADAHETTLTTVDATGDRTISLPNVSGTLPVLAAASATAITSTPEELNLLDTASANSVVNSKAVIYGSSGELAGTLSTAAQGNVTSVGALNSGTITSGFGNIDTGSSTITTTGAVATGALTTTGASSITTADNLDTLSLISTDADANRGPNLRMYRNSGSPADGDLTAVVEFEGRNDNSQDVVYGQIKINAADVSDGTEDANMLIGTMVDGTVRSRIGLDPTETVFNEDTIDLDFRVESNGNANMLFVDGGNDRVGIGTASPLTNSTLHIVSTASSGVSSISNGVLILENNTGVGLGLLSNNDRQQTIAFGDPEDNDIGKINYGHDTNALTFFTNATQQLEIASTGKATFAGSVIGGTDTDTSNTGNVALDFAANQNFVLTLTGNTTLTNPSTESVGQSGFIAFIQDGTGSRTITLGTDYETAGGVGITLTTAASATDLVPYVVVASGRILLGQPQKAFS